MKYILSIIAATFAFSQGYCGTEPKIESSEKIYVQPHQIAFSDNGIFVQVGGEWVATEALHTDAIGIYAVDNKPRTKMTWTCPKSYCRHENPWYVNKCQRCGKRYNEE